MFRDFVAGRRGFLSGVSIQALGNPWLARLQFEEPHMASQPPQPDDEISPIPMDQDLATDDPQLTDIPPADTADTVAPGQATTAPVDVDNDATAAATQTVVPAPASAPPTGATEPGRSVRGGNMAMRVFSRAKQDLDVLTGGTRAATYDEVSDYVGHAIRIERGLEGAARAAQPAQQDQPVAGPAEIQQPIQADGMDPARQVPDGDRPADTASISNAVYMRPLPQAFGPDGANAGWRAPPAAYLRDIARRQTTLPNPSDKMLAHAQTLQAAKKPGPAGKPGSPAPSAPRESRVFGITINRANAASWAKLIKFDPDAPIFIGGGGDGYGSDNVRDFVKQRGKGTFFRHMDNEGIDAAIAINYALGKPIILVGHSWGAYAAMTAASRAAKKGIRVDLLETIDPIDGPIRALNSVTSDNVDDLKSKVGLWVDVRATKYETSPDWNDGVASTGGRFDSAAQSRADVYLESNRDHAAFEQMYHEVLTDRMIQTIYYNYKHK
jgi:hypothetical protein